jgi:hypothetical protein
MERVAINNFNLEDTFITSVKFCSIPIVFQRVRNAYVVAAVVINNVDQKIVISWKFSSTSWMKYEYTRGRGIFRDCRLFILLVRLGGQDWRKIIELYWLKDLYHFIPTKWKAIIVPTIPVS